MELFDEEYYLLDWRQSALAANGKYVRLNPTGDLNDSPEFKGKAKLGDVSQFEWQGFEWVDAWQVPPEYLSESGKVSFKNAEFANNQLLALKRWKRWLLNN